MEAGAGDLDVCVDVAPSDGIRSETSRPSRAEIPVRLEDFRAWRIRQRPIELVAYAMLLEVVVVELAPCDRTLALRRFLPLVELPPESREQLTS